MSRQCARRSKHCGSGWAMQPARQERRLEVSPARSKGAVHEIEQQFRCDPTETRGDAPARGRRRFGGDVLSDAEAHAGGTPWPGYHRAFPQGKWGIRLRRFEEGALAEMVSAIAGADAAGPLPAIRKIPGRGGSRSEFASR